MPRPPRGAAWRPPPAARADEQAASFPARGATARPGSARRWREGPGPRTSADVHSHCGLIGRDCVLTVGAGEDGVPVPSAVTPTLEATAITPAAVFENSAAYHDRRDGRRTSVETVSPASTRMPGPTARTLPLSDSSSTT